jgi:hypothetical protein
LLGGLKRGLGQIFSLECRRVFLQSILKVLFRKDFDDPE